MQGELYQKKNSIELEWSFMDTAPKGTMQWDAKKCSLSEIGMDILTPLFNSNFGGSWWPRLQVVAAKLNYFEIMRKIIKIRGWYHIVK